MTIKRHSALLTALTLVLGIAILTTTLAVPQMRSVQNAAGAAETQVLSTAAAGAQEAAAQEAKHITVAMPAIPSDPGILPSDPGGPNDWVYRPLAGDSTADSPIPYPYQVWEHEKSGDKVPKGIAAPYSGDAAARNWRDLPPSTLDILSPYKSMSTLTNNVHHPAVPHEDLEPMDILIPGCAGQYKFTLENVDPLLAIDYLINLEDAHNQQKFPLRFRLTYRDGVNDIPVTDGWKYMDEIEKEWLPSVAAPGVLAVGQSRVFTLDWEWEYERQYERGTNTPALAENDEFDTKIGKDVEVGLPTEVEPDVWEDGDWDSVPQYQLKLNLLVRMPDGDVLVIFDYQGGSGTPAQKTYKRGEKLGPLPVPDARSGYSFQHWKYADGTIATPDDDAPLDGSVTLYAVWQQDGNPNPGGWKYIPIPLPIPIPIPLPIIPIVLPCWKCLRSHDKCICEKPGKTEPFAKTGDSMAVAYSALALLTVAGGAALYLHRKRREEDE